MLPVIEVLNVVARQGVQYLSFCCDQVSLQATYTGPELVAAGKYNAVLNIAAEEILLYEYPHPFELSVLEANRVSFKGRIDALEQDDGQVTVYWHFDATPFCIGMDTAQHALMGQGDFIEGTGLLEIAELTAI